jgi:hypothetical protein
MPRKSELSAILSARPLTPRMTGLAAGIGLFFSERVLKMAVDLPRVPLAACQPVFLGYFGAALADKQPVAPRSQLGGTPHVYPHSDA